MTEQSHEIQYKETHKERTISTKELLKNLLQNIEPQRKLSKPTKTKNINIPSMPNRTNYIKNTGKKKRRK